MGISFSVFRRKEREHSRRASAATAGFAKKRGAGLVYCQSIHKARTHAHARGCCAPRSDAGLIGLLSMLVAIRKLCRYHAPIPSLDVTGVPREWRKTNICDEQCVCAFRHKPPRLKLGCSIRDRSITQPRSIVTRRDGCANAGSHARYGFLRIYAIRGVYGNDRDKGEDSLSESACQLSQECGRLVHAPPRQKSAARACTTCTRPLCLWNRPHQLRIESAICNKYDTCNQLQVKEVLG